MAAPDHPRQQFEGVGSCLIRGRQGQGRQAPFDKRAKLFAFFDGLDFGRFQRAADDQAHPAVITDQSFDTPRRQPQRVGTEIPGQAVIALGVPQGGNVEQAYEVAVVGGVFELPVVVAEHGSSD